MTSIMEVQEVPFNASEKIISDTSFKNEYLPKYGIQRYMLDYNDTKYHLESRGNKMDLIMPYFRRVSKDFNRVELSESVLSGMPRIKNTRIPVNLIISCFRDGMSIEEIMEDYNISNADIIEALDFVVAVMTRPYMDDKSD